MTEVQNSTLSVTASRVGLICHKDQLKRKKNTSRLGFTRFTLKSMGIVVKQRKVCYTEMICSTAGGAVVTHRIDFSKTARLSEFLFQSIENGIVVRFLVYFFYFLNLVKHCFTCSLIEASTALNSICETCGRSSETASRQQQRDVAASVYFFSFHIHTNTHTGCLVIFFV